MENNLHWTDMLLADTNEYIVEEASDWWVCRCGNQPDGDGFASCSQIGERCEPTIGEWTANTGFVSPATASLTATRWKWSVLVAKMS